MKIDLENSELNIITNLLSERIAELEDKIPDINENTYLEICLLQSKIHAILRLQFAKNKVMSETKFEGTIVGDPMDNSSKRLMEAIRKKPEHIEEKITIDSIGNDVKEIITGESNMNHE